MNNKLIKTGFTPLERILASRGTDFQNRFLTGFTLIEILAAVAIIAMIVSMVYGSFAATSRSIEACRTRMATFADAARLLEQIAGQIRCAYIAPASLSSQKESKDNKNKPVYFSGGLNGPAGEILHIVTTRTISAEVGLSEGLFDVTYHFDGSKGLLSISQQAFTGASESVFEKRTWQELAKNVESVELAFFDGERWLSKWDFRDKAFLPSAVRINITFKDEKYRLHDYGTVVYIFCKNNQGISPVH
ncbi:MAG: prepilin-type N-terminal cleavage/methylation domain-containing protein [Sedimentisphaerales bacterium]|nr:prepilin-type N-terminal cleavage/methylation domain-containing protein [Sedimentisphaerales bacterium]